MIGYNFLRPLLWPVNVDKVSGRREPTQTDLPIPFELASMSENLVPHALDIGSEQDPFLLEASDATPSPDQNQTPQPSTFRLRVLPQTRLRGPHHVWQDTEIQCLGKKDCKKQKVDARRETLTQ